MSDSIGKEIGFFVIEIYIVSEKKLTLYLT